MGVYERLQEKGITLPEVGKPVAAFVPWVQTGNLIFTSGSIAKRNEQPWTGKLGAEVSLEDGKRAARQIAVDLLAVLQAATGDLRKVRRIVKLLVLVNSDAGFTEQHLVANGASELLAEIFGEEGAHARSAFGVAQIPFGACVEIEMIAEIG
jgi:enamine deaminase RidA (YjgF/YER057c/UK114 family)